MKINQWRIPGLIASVLFLSLFLVPCVMVHAQDPSFTVEQQAFIKNAITEGTEKLATKEDMTELNTSVQAVDDKVNAVKTKVDAQATKLTALEINAGSTQTPTWIVVCVIVALALGAACLVLLVLAFIPLAPMLNGKKYEAAQTAKREAELNKILNPQFEVIQGQIGSVKTEIGSVKTEIGSVKMEIGSVKMEIGSVKSEISGVKNEVNTSVANGVGAVKADVKTKIEGIKLPKADEIANKAAEIVTGKIRSDIDGVNNFINKTQDILKKTENFINNVNRDYNGALSLLNRIDSDRKQFEREKETIKNQLETEKQKNQNAFDNRKRELDESELALARTKNELEEKKAGLEAKEKSLEEEKNGLAKSIADAKENTRTDCKMQFDQEKASLDLQIEKLKNEVDTLTEGKTALVSENSGLKKEVASLNKDNTELKVQVGAFEAKEETHKETLTAYSAQLDEAKEANAILAAGNAALLKEKEDWAKEKKEKDDRIFNLANDNKAIQIAIAKEKQDEINRLNGELETISGQIVDLKTDNKAKEDKIKALESERETLSGNNSKLQDSLSKSEALIYPKEFMSKPKFVTLKQHLDEWVDIPESAIIRVSLQLFSQRDLLDAETKAFVLRNISYGITKTLSSTSPALKKTYSPDDVFDELVLWCDFIRDFANSRFNFTLQVPAIDKDFDAESMIAKNNTQIDKVHKIHTWMVIVPQKNFRPIKKLAEVE